MSDGILAPRVREFLSRYRHVFLNFIWPVRCAVCNAEAESYFCAACKAKIAMPEERLRCPLCGKVMMLPEAVGGSVPELCGQCRKQRPAYDKARAAAAYAEPLSRLVTRYKYNNDTFHAGDFTDLMERCVRECFAGDMFHTFCPVPLHSSRFRHRGYNQADYLARGLARRFHLDHEPELLRRVRPTATQTRKGANERKANMAGAFVSPSGLRHRVYGRNIMLVDDVMTTGSTLDECAAALKANGAVKVYAVALCRR